MTVLIQGRNVPEAYVEGLQKFRVFGEEEITRLGPALVIPDIVELSILYPDERVLFDPVRKPNPFFHAMEFVWMMAGSNDVRWIETYNSRMRQYADTGTDYIRGAYGWRWLVNAGDQIATVIRMLREDHLTRRAVIEMWDANFDLEPGHNDYPCNTHICFRGRPNNYLDMTVFNRSNDFIWGMLGANAVHMTFLHELIAAAAGKVLGVYKVISNHCHIYKSIENYPQIVEHTIYSPNPYYNGNHDAVVARPLLGQKETYEMFISDAVKAVLSSPGWHSEFETGFFKDVFRSIHFAYDARKRGLNPGAYIAEIKADDWRLACQRWGEWKIATQGEG